MNPARKPGGGHKSEPMVLIVNGDHAARDWIEATVTAIGLRAMTFESGRDLLSGFPVDRAACAILDLTLADADGLDLQEKLARAGAAVVFVTRERNLASCVRAIKAGAVDFLSMPCDACELVRVLRDALREALTRWRQHEELRQLRSRFDGMTQRERQVFALVSTGMSNKQIAADLDISEITVQIHRGRAFRKMGARSLAALVRMADRLQICAQNAPEAR